MTVYFLDSSTLVKRYVMETGTNWLRGLIDANAQNALILARITGVETLSALARKQREGRLAQEDVRQAILTFQYDLDLSKVPARFRADLRALNSLDTPVLRHVAYTALDAAKVTRCEALLMKNQRETLLAEEQAQLSPKPAYFFHLWAIAGFVLYLPGTS